MSRAVRIFEGRKDEIFANSTKSMSRQEMSELLALRLVIAVRTDSDIYRSTRGPHLNACASSTFEFAANRITDTRLPVPKQ